MSAFLDRQSARASPTSLLALYRAFLTVVLEKIEMVDDSFGAIGDLYESIFEAYFQLDRAECQMTAADFFQDLMELLIWEDYGFTRAKKPALFASLSSLEVPIVERILRTQWSELREIALDSPAEKALTMLGMLCTQQRLYDQFVDLAKAMGTREWERITTMAELAEKHRKYDLAVAVYEACLRPGWHESFLRQKYEELKGRIREKRGKGKPHEI